MKRATLSSYHHDKNLSHFNPHPLWRGRLSIGGNQTTVKIDFNPHPLWRGRQDFHFTPPLIPIFQSTPSVKRATYLTRQDNFRRAISIHTLCEEGDITIIFPLLILIYFNPHPLWRGRLFWSIIDRDNQIYFNLHPLWRGRRASNIIVNIAIFNFNPHPLWRGRHDQGIDLTRVFCYFNPHPLWRGRPFFTFSEEVNCSNFNPHPLWRGRPFTFAGWYPNMSISIHTLCEEGDVQRFFLTNFYHAFQSTPSVKRATGLCCFSCCCRQISIHTLCEEGDDLRRQD